MSFFIRKPARKVIASGAHSLITIIILLRNLNLLQLIFGCFRGDGLNAALNMARNSKLTSNKNVDIFNVLDKDTVYFFVFVFCFNLFSTSRH